MTWARNRNRPAKEQLPNRFRLHYCQRVLPGLPKCRTQLILPSCQINQQRKEKNGVANIIVNLHSELPPVPQVEHLEPSAAKGGDVVLCTVLHHYQQSIDSGLTWNSYDLHPEDLHPPFKDLTGDQSVLWMTPIQRFAMITLDCFYGTPGTSLRVAILDLSQVPTAGNPVWMTFQIDSSHLGLTNLGFDYPQLTVSTRYLYITCNLVNMPNTAVLRRDGSPAGWSYAAITLRFALADLWLLQSKQLGFQYIIHPGTTFLAMTQNSVDIAYYATHVSDSELKLFRWVESQNSITSQTVLVPTWSGADYSSLTPDNQNWMEMLGSRMTGATSPRGDLVFAWTCGRDEIHPHPFIRLVMLSRDGEKWHCTGYRDIWHRELAWGFPSITSAGFWLGATPTPHIAMSCGWGGAKNHFANFAAGFVEMPITSTSNFVHHTMAKSEVGKPRWGDFLTTHPHDRRADTFVTAGFIIRNTRASWAKPGDVESIVHYVEYAII